MDDPVEIPVGDVSAPAAPPAPPADAGAPTREGRCQGAARGMAGCACPACQEDDAAHL